MLSQELLNLEALRFACDLPRFSEHPRSFAAVFNQVTFVLFAMGAAWAWINSLAANKPGSRSPKPLKAMMWDPF